MSTKLSGHERALLALIEDVEVRRKAVSLVGSMFGIGRYYAHESGNFIVEDINGRAGSHAVAWDGKTFFKGVIIKEHLYTGTKPEYDMHYVSIGNASEVREFRDDRVYIL